MITSSKRICPERKSLRWVLLFCLINGISLKLRLGRCCILKKTKWNNKFCSWFNLPKDRTKIVYFRNPSEFARFNYEPINPNHKGVIWGYSKNKNWIRVGRTSISNVFVLLFERFTSFFQFIYQNLEVTTLIWVCCFCFFIYAIWWNIPVLEGLLFVRN